MLKPHPSRLFQRYFCTMQSRKHIWTIALMVSSIILLLVLQTLWLRSAYNEALESFRKETNSLFRTTIIGLHDSLIMKGLQPVVTGDSMEYKRSADKPSQIMIWNTRIKRDSLLSKIPPEKVSQIEVRDSTVQIFLSVNREGDSVKQVLRPIVSEIRRRREPGKFIFRFGNDSLRIDDIQRKYSDTLKATGIMLSPKVRTIALGVDDPTESKLLLTEPFFLPHTPTYQAQFENVRPMLLAKISPQIAFSIVLTSLIITAFVLMYRSIRSQQRLMQLKNDLISNITHELKTPVATVSVALEAMRNFKALDNPALTAEYLNIAQQELKRLTLMTDKILKTSSFEEIGLKIKTEDTDIENIIHEVLTSLKLVFEKHQAQISFEKEGDDFIIRANSEHFTNVVYNLLDNALKYGKPGCQIKIRLVKNQHNIQLSVQDNGIGIPTEHQSKVFDKFFRVPTGDVHNARGYGLGLSYVASVVKSLKGTIELKSEAGKGSIFTITLPA